MNRILFLLDGPSLGGLVAVGFIYIILPLAALILLIWLFIKHKNKKR
jgi:hypothetical protein